MIYQKLVRDKIPEIIRSQGEYPVFRVLEEEEFFSRLREKLDEEVTEFHKEENLEELADILEVVFTLADTLGYSTAELMECCQQKREKRGSFRDRIFLVAKETAHE